MGPTGIGYSLFGYGYQTWLISGKERQFMLRGPRPGTETVDGQFVRVRTRWSLNGQKRTACLSAESGRSTAPHRRIDDTADRLLLHALAIE